MLHVTDVTDVTCVTNVTLVINVTPCNTRWYKPSVTSFWSYILLDFETQFFRKTQAHSFQFGTIYIIFQSVNLKQY